MRTHSNTTVSSTFDQSGAVECGFDTDGTAHLMSILSNMYRDAPLAVLREYAANAADSHVQAGTTAPIEVTLPSDWDPRLTVRDYGTGLTEREIIDVYASYGSSTKRDTDHEVGAFGIGAKAAFTLSGQFTIAGVKDGAKTLALFAVNERGVGTVDIHDRSATTEPNGVTVTIPVTDPAAMRHAAATLFATWSPGSVLLDGHQPESLTASMLPVADGLYVRTVEPHQADTRTGITVVMGGIPYPTSESMLRTLARTTTDPTVTRLLTDLARAGSRVHLLAHVPVGTVDITPSREDLRDTPRTLEALTRIAGTLVDELGTAIAHAVQHEPSPMHAAIRLGELQTLLREVGHDLASGITWHGQLLAHRLHVPHRTLHLPPAARKSDELRDQDHYEAHLGQNFTGVLVITGVDTAHAAKTVRRLARRYLTHTATHTLLLAPQPAGHTGWFAWGGSAPIDTLTVEEFRQQAQALPSLSHRTNRTVSYCVATDGRVSTWTSGQITDAEANGKRILVGQDHNQQFLRLALAPSDLVILLTGQQTERAAYRRFPSATAAAPILRGYARTLLDNATETELRAITHEDHHPWASHREQIATELRGVDPIDRFLTEQEQERQAHRAITPARREVLQAASVLLGQPREYRPSHVLDDYPILRMLLTDTPPQMLRRHLDEHLREHLSLYASAVHTHQLSAA